MSLTQHNSDISIAGTQRSGAGRNQFYGSNAAVEAELDGYSKSPGQCEDAWGVYLSPYDMKVAELKRAGRI